MKKHLFAIMDRLIASAALPAKYRARCLRGIGVRVGDANIFAHSPMGSPRTRIGDGCFININCVLDGADAITIGDKVHLAIGVTILTSTHAIGPSACRAGALLTAPVEIGAGSWIGAGATIMPGITIAPGCIIAAGSIVTRDTQAGGLYLGSPARRIRDLDMESTSADLVGGDGLEPPTRSV